MNQRDYLGSGCFAVIICGFFITLRISAIVAVVVLCGLALKWVGVL